MAAEQFMGVFVDSENMEVIKIGVNYLRIEGSCYIGIGILFLLYGYYRAITKPGMSVVLTAISLGTRVVLAYFLSSFANRCNGNLACNSDWMGTGRYSGNFVWI